MITEDYVSFETAKLLKEKGFKGECQCFYEISPEDGITRVCGTDCHNNINRMFEYSRPTLQMAMKWLRKKHKLHCRSDYDIVWGWYCQITSLKETVQYDDYEEVKHYYPEKHNHFSSPEEACEVAIKYCLENLI